MWFPHQGMPTKHALSIEAENQIGWPRRDAVIEILIDQRPSMVIHVRGLAQAGDAFRPSGDAVSHEGEDRAGLIRG